MSSEKGAPEPGMHVDDQVRSCLVIVLLFPLVLLPMALYLLGVIALPWIVPGTVILGVFWIACDRASRAGR